MKVYRKLFSNNVLNLTEKMSVVVKFVIKSVSLNQTRKIKNNTSATEIIILQKVKPLVKLSARIPFCSVSKYKRCLLSGATLSRI